MASLQGLTYRRATIEDFQAIMDINRDVYTGMDHLPYKYKDDISCPFRFGAVAEVNGKVVSTQIRYSRFST